jgi:Fur family ferric uptake transcriptional regulator
MIFNNNKMKKELEVLDNYIREKGLRRTSQREKVLAVFLATEKHISVEELHKLVKKKHPDIGYTTVYRTMKLCSATGLCDSVDFGDGLVRFEHKFGHNHHDHLICIKCGNLIETLDPKIEKLQERMVKKYDFVSLRHTLEIFGICKKCRK